MKVFIHTDLEGISGGFFDWAEAEMRMGRGIGYTREILTQEVNAAAQGILEADPSAEVVVEDGHGGGYWGPNILCERLDPRVRLLVGKFNRHLVSIDRGYGLFMMVGAHSMAGTPQGLMNHTLSAAKYLNFLINGVTVGEIGICTAIAGYYGVPLAMVSGDHWAVLEARTLQPNVRGASVKKGISRYNAECVATEAACGMIREAAREAVANAGEFRPYVVEGDVKVRIDYMQTDQADDSELKRGARRLDGRSVQFEGTDLIEVLSRFVTT
ncbi:MAG: M55 family metallopeptidase [Oscillospiraceae bacterium]|nr:M55 family metallopeptidase [Oscillospiraceae bacterium]